MIRTQFQTSPNYFSTYFIFVKSEYWQISVDPADRSKTAFVTSSGPFEFNRMSFDEKTSPATFQRAMEILPPSRPANTFIYTSMESLWHLIAITSLVVSIYGNPSSKPPIRIERWALRLQLYQLTVRYWKEEGTPADYSSRHPSKPQPAKNRRTKRSLLITSPWPQRQKAIMVQEIEKATKADATDKRYLCQWRRAICRKGLSIRYGERSW